MADFTGVTPFGCGRSRSLGRIIGHSPTVRGRRLRLGGREAGNRLFKKACYNCIRVRILGPGRARIADHAWSRRGGTTY